MAIEYTKTENVVHTWKLPHDAAFHVYDNNKWITITSANDNHEDGFHIHLNDDTCSVLEAILDLYRRSQ